MKVGLGTVVRYSILNASNTRTYRVVAPKGSTLKIVGGDSGRYEREFLADTYILAPSERVIAEVSFWDDGVAKGISASRTVTLVEAGSPRDPVPVLTATIIGGKTQAAPVVMRQNDDVIRSIDPFRSSFDKNPDHTLVIGMSMMGGAMMHGHGEMMGRVPEGGIEWEDAPGMMDMMGMMKWQLRDEDTGDANEDLMYTAHVGDKLKIRIVNPADSPHPMQHPVHFHGQRFLVIADNGVKSTNFVWKDTVLVPAGHTVDILLDISNPGDWMFHCHIAEHLSNGMMGMLKVLP
jgi:FtsP/CotA-like multicopper oxidase with cupredoxin domain